MRASLIVNADDYGFTPAVSAGIRAAHRDGIVTSTSVLIVAPSARSDLLEAGRTCPDLGIGVHLTLTGGWRPILDDERVRSLTARRGRFASKAAIADVIARAEPNDVSAEWRAQIEAVIAVGISPDHLDSHHDIAYRSPPLTEVLVALAAEYALPIRVAIDDTVAEQADASKIAHPDQLIDGFSAEPSTARLLTLLESVRPDSVTELECHPGKVDWRLRVKSSYTREREGELAALTDASVKRWIEQRGVTLTTFAALTR
jgi:chitin disaccharide deacetylase